MVDIIKQKDLLQKINVKKYQLFICVSPTSLPLFGFFHAYIVVNCKGVVTRWDVWHTKNRVATSDGFVHKNTYKPRTGLSVVYGDNLSESRMRWHIKSIGFEEGNEDSLAYHMCTFINKNAYKYPLKDTYQFRGPNSNTFVQWFLDYFPESDIILPRRAVGKSFDYNKHINSF